MWFFALMMIFINIIIYYSSKRDAQYQEGMLFLVTIPKYALESIEVQQIVTFFNRYLNIMLICSCFISSILIILEKLFTSILFVFLLLIIIFIDIAILQIPFKKARDKLINVKRKNNWLVLQDKVYRVDLELAAVMEHHSFKSQRYLVIVIINIFTVMIMIKYRANLMMYPFIFFQIFVLLGGLLFINRQGNQTFCDNSDANIKINFIRKNTFHDCFFFLILCDSLFNLVVQLYLLEKLNFIYLIFLITLSFIVIILTLYKVNDYLNKKNEILTHFNKTSYNFSNDDCWKVGLFGPVYYNPYDPRMLISMPSGMQLAFNTAKKSYRYFMISILSVICLFFIWLFGYPYYLDITNNLVDLSLEDNKIIITSEFYEYSINIDKIKKMVLSKDLGEGRRTNGTDTGIYAKGRYTFNKYGDCKVYLASLHECYIIIYTKDETYIINDDKIEDTKQFYYQLNEVIKSDN